MQAKRNNKAATTGRGDDLACQLAAQLAREQRGEYRTVRELAADARTVAAAAARAGDAVRNGKRPRAADVREIAAILDEYEAVMIVAGDGEGPAIGARFRSKAITCELSRTFALA